MFVYFIPLTVNLTKNSKLEKFGHELNALWELSGSSLGALRELVAVAGVPSLKCLVLKLQQLSLLRTSKISGNKLMKGHHLFSVESPSCITRQRHCIQCLPWCTLHIWQHAHVKVSLLCVGGLGSLCYSKRWLVTILSINYRPYASLKQTSTGSITLSLQHGWLGRALQNNLIPGNCFLKKGSNCINAVMTKIFICD